MADWLPGTVIASLAVVVACLSYRNAVKARKVSEQALAIERDRREEEVERALQREPDLEIVSSHEPWRGFEICDRDGLDVDIAVSLLPPIDPKVGTVRLGNQLAKAKEGIELTASLPPHGSVTFSLEGERRSAVTLRLRIDCTYKDGKVGVWSDDVELPARPSPPKRIR